MAPGGAGLGLVHGGRHGVDEMELDGAGWWLVGCCQLGFRVETDADSEEAEVLNTNPGVAKGRGESKFREE